MSRTSHFARTSHIARVLFAGVAGAALIIVSPVATAVIAPASAQGVVVSIEFRTALAPYGTWRRVPRWGEVWIPARVSRDWRPYSVGHWVYTEDYGWYWISVEEEAEWGWITFHYGRWVFVEPYGWVWVPGNVWGPAWVDWRYGDEFVGWAPLPPDEVIVEYRADPSFWLFVRVVDLIAPRPRYVYVSLPERRRIWQQTILVNSTVYLRERRFAVNPGVSPALVAAAARRPLRTFTVRPQIVAGTANIQAAMEIREQDLRRGGDRPGRIVVQQRSVQQATTTVQPAPNVSPPRALGPNERGRLGDNPPRAATGARDRGTTGTAPPEQRGVPTQREQQDRMQPGAPSGQPPRGAAPPLVPRDDRAPDADRPRTQERGPDAGTTGVGPQPREAPGPRDDQPAWERVRPQGPTGTSPERRPEAPFRRDDRDRGLPPDRSSVPPSGTTGSAPPEQRQAPRPDQRRQQAAPPPQAPDVRPPAATPRPPRPQPPAAEPQPAPRAPTAQPRRAPQQPATTGSGSQPEDRERGR